MSDSTYAALMVSTGNSVIVTKNCGATESMLDGLDSATLKLVNALEAYAAQCDSEVLTMALESDGDAASSSSVISAYKTGDPKTAISNVNDSLSTAKSENKKGNVKKAIIITLGVIAAMLAIVTIAGRVKTGKWQFPHTLIKQWLDLRKKGKALKDKPNPAEQEVASFISETETLVTKTAAPAVTAVKIKTDDSGVVTKTERLSDGTTKTTIDTSKAKQSKFYADALSASDKAKLKTIAEKRVQLLNEEEQLSRALLKSGNNKDDAQDKVDSLKRAIAKIDDPSKRAGYESQLKAAVADYDQKKKAHDQLYAERVKVKTRLEQISATVSRFMKSKGVTNYNTGYMVPGDF